MVDGTEQSGQSSSQGGTQQSQSSGSQSASGSQSSQASGQSGQTQQPSQQQTQQTAARPEYVPETHWDSAAGKVKDEKAFAGWINEHVTFKAAEDSRRLSMPQNADAYKAELPSDFKPPEGVEFKFNADDPLLAQARTLAHQSGLSQENFSKLLGLYAGSQVASQQAVTVARNTEIAKLGAAGPARVDAVTTFMKSFLGEADGQLLASRMFTARDVEVVEKLVAKVTSQGGSTFKGTGREAPQSQGRVSDEQYAKMSPAQRLDYARQFDQSKFTNGRAA